ncbi:M20/M25/M40 family metallo-hydrolase [Gemmatimonas sp.]
MGARVRLVEYQARTLARQIAFTRIAAPTGCEHDRARSVLEALQHAGYADASIDGVGNVRAVAGGGDAAPLVCLAHLDTVYDSALAPTTEVSVIQSGPVLHGTGIGDNGRGLAALLTLAQVLREPTIRARVRRPVHLVATVGEEGDGDLRGARAWFDDAAANGLTPWAAVAIDGPGDESIVHHAAGSHRLRVTLHGPGGHSWTHAESANPIHALGEFIARAARLGDARRREAVVHVTRMHGGECLTAIPQQAWADVDLRGTSARRLNDVRRELLRLVAEITPPTLRAEIVVLGDRPAGVLPAGHALVQMAVQATEAVGVSPRSAVASTDANIPLSRGIPAIAIGAGGTGGGAHTRDEWYDDTHGARGIERLVRLVLSLAAD